MAEFPTYEQMAKNVAEKALDEFLYDGKSIREWMKIIAEQEPCDDAVSRQAVLDIAKQHTLTNDYLAIQNLPSVRPQEQTGHWILQPSNKEQGERDFIWWKCSECGQVIFSETEKDKREYHAFCGRCGARMV